MWRQPARTVASRIAYVVSVRCGWRQNDVRRLRPSHPRSFCHHVPEPVKPPLGVVSLREWPPVYASFTTYFWYTSACRPIWYTTCPADIVALLALPDSPYDTNIGALRSTPASACGQRGWKLAEMIQPPSLVMQPLRELPWPNAPAALVQKGDPTSW